MGMYGHIIIYTWYWYIYIWYDIDIYVYMYIQCNLKIYRTWYNLKSNSSTLHLEHARGSTAKKDFQGLFYEECITKLSTCSPSDQETSSKQITKQPIMGYMMLYVLLFIFIWIYDIYIYIFQVKNEFLSCPPRPPPCISFAKTRVPVGLRLPHQGLHGGLKTRPWLWLGFSLK